MAISRRVAAISAGLVGLSALGVAALRRQAASQAVRALTGKVVLITGGSRGLGFAIATELALCGAKLVLSARDLAELERAREHLVASCAIKPVDVFLQAADVSHPEQMRSVVDEATRYFGRIDVLINNAGIILVGPVESQTAESFQLAMNINFYGALYTTLAVLPQMMARGDGAIVNIASIGGKVAFPHLLPYVASKFALTGWSQGLRAELAQHNIRVTTVTPGVMRTGSHIQARYAGNTQKEYRWFASAASFPGSATSASVAAKKIVRAFVNASAEVSIGLQAILASRLANLAPELTAGLLSAAGRLLPDAPGDHSGKFWESDQSTIGKIHRGSLSSPLEWFGEKAIHRYNQEAEL